MAPRHRLEPPARVPVSYNLDAASLRHPEPYVEVPPPRSPSGDGPEQLPAPNATWMTVVDGAEQAPAVSALSTSDALYLAHS